MLHEQLRFDAGRVLLKRDPRHANDLPITHSSIRRSAHPSAADQQPLLAARSHAMSPLRKSICIEAAVPRRVVGLPDVTEPRAHAGEEYVHVEWREREHKCAEERRKNAKGSPKGRRRDVEGMSLDIEGTVPSHRRYCNETLPVYARAARRRGRVAPLAP